MFLYLQFKSYLQLLMNTNFSNTNFYHELESSLPTSSAAQRRVWATTIIEKEVDIKVLSELLKGEQKIAVRFLWLMSELGTVNPDKLFYELPFLLNVCEKLNPTYMTSFAGFWLITGVPIENEGKAIDLLFKWLLSNETNVTIKARSFLVLYELTKKYPELSNELKLCLHDQMDRHTNSFKKRATTLLAKMER